MARQPLDVREWLEDMLRFNGRNADRARELLDLLDEQQDEQDLLAAYGKRCGDLEEAAEKIRRHDAIMEEYQGSELAVGFLADDILETTRDVLIYAAKLEAENWAIRELVKEAGLLGEKDETTPVVPLLRMFLPV